MYPVDQGGAPLSFSSAGFLRLSPATKQFGFEGQSSARVFTAWGREMRIGKIRVQGVRVGSLATLLALAFGFASLFAYWSWVIMLRPSPLPPILAEGRADKLASQVQARHFFGVTGEGGALLPSVSDTAQMALAGIVSSGNATRGLAIILIEGGKTVTARVGQEVVPDVILSRVASDYVELTRRGQTINLRLAAKK